jgi:hypothetical protein
MKFSSQSRFVAACIALFSMLFMQLAVASYTCPGMTMGNESASAVMSSDGVDQMAMTGCEGMDMEQPTLCHAHAYGEAARQSLDKSELPPVQPFVPAGLVLSLLVADIASVPSFAPHTSILLTRTTAPPVAIRHCCFRI